MPSSEQTAKWQTWLPDQPIARLEDWGLDVRYQNKLEEVGYLVVRDVLLETYEGLLEIDNFGTKGADQVMTAIRRAINGDEPDTQPTYDEGIERIRSGWSESDELSHATGAIRHASIPGADLHPACPPRKQGQ